MSLASTFLKCCRHGTWKPVIRLGITRRYYSLLYQDSRAVDYLMTHNEHARLEKEYGGRVDLAGSAARSDRPTSNMIWTCWLQGLERAPLLVRCCINSLGEHIADRSVTCITDDNLRDYVSFPGFILDKRKKGIIPPAQFSDLIRLELLIQHGGLWADATVLCSANVPPYIQNAPLFVYSANQRSTAGAPIVASNWLISAEAQSQILTTTRDLLYAYWEKENILCHYHLFHLFFAMATRRHPEEWAGVPVVSNKPPHVLQSMMNDEYDEQVIQRVLASSPFHKLDHRMRSLGRGHSVYDWIVAADQLGHTRETHS